MYELWMCDSMCMVDGVFMVCFMRYDMMHRVMHKGSEKRRSLNDSALLASKEHSRMVFAYTLCLRVNLSFRSQGRLVEA